MTAPEEQSNIKKLAIKGTFWTLMSFGLGQIIRFGSNLILTRLLAPELFGMVSLLMVFLLGIAFLTDLGIAPNIIRSARGTDPDFLNTAWTVSVFRGFGVWVAAIIISFPLADIYEKPEIALLLPILSLMSVINSFSSTSLIVLNRDLNLKTSVLVELVVQVVSLTIQIVWAWISPSIWPLIVGTLVSTLVRTIWSHYLIPGHRNRFCWEKSAVAEIFSFGRWIFVSSILTFLASQADRAVLGKVLSFEMLGIYSVAFAISELPNAVVQGVSSRVLFPAVSRMIHRPAEEIRQVLSRNRLKILLLLVLGLGFMMAFGDVAIRILYDTRYQAAMWMLPLLAIGVWFSILASTMEPVLLALGKTGYQAVGNGFRLVFNLAGIPLGFLLAGVPGAILAVALRHVPFYFVVAWGSSKAGIANLRQDFVLSLLLVVVVAALFGMRLLFGWGSPLAGMAPGF